jgi:microcin C transport system substrate-binding protein
LPVNRGRYNFQTIRFDFYRDRNVEFEAFKAHEYDFREEFTSKVWATSYKFPAVKKGLVVVETVPDASPANRQNFMLNLRRAKFQDRGVRQAFDLAFDFEWINKNLFYGLYSRTLSVYQNTSMAARDLPGPAELALLEPHRAGLPAEVFSQIYQPPKSDGLGNNRRNLRQAAKLLSAAGWRIEDGRRVNAAGQAFELEFLTFSPTFERVYAPIVRNLKKLGIRATIRVVDSAQYANRMQEFDFDVSTTAFGGQTTPGVGERTFWGSEAANSPGSINYAGIADPVVDDLVARIAAAQTRPELETAARALDRVLLWNQYLIPQWFRAFHPIAYWDRFSRPATKPKYGLGFLDTWWHDTDKAARLAAKAKR